MYVGLASRAQDGKAKYTPENQKEDCIPLADVVRKDTTWRAPVRKEHFLQTRAARQGNNKPMHKDIEYWRSPPKNPKDIRLWEKTSDTTFET